MNVSHRLLPVQSKNPILQRAIKSMGELKDIEFPICHRLPERSFFYRGIQFPICARCTGLILGTLTLPLFALKILSFGFLWILILNAPVYIDGTTQALGWRESKNWLRLLTGLLSGVGQMGLIALIGDFLIVKFLLIFYY